MRQYFKTKEVSYNAIFYSAFKALIVLELLMQSPKTLDELCDALIKSPHVKSNISKDTLRVYINSFKIAGCKVEKKLTGEKHREYAYFIKENPFRPVISNLQIEKLFDIYDVIMYNMPFEEFLNTDILFRKFMECFNNPVFNEAYCAHSLLKDMDFDLLRTLEQCCQENSLVTVLYNSPRSGLKEIPIIAHQMKIQSDKLYIEGFGMEYNQEAIFLLNRIVKITNIVSSANIKMPEDNMIDVICEFYDSDIELTPNETVISQTDSVRTVMHKTSNKVLNNHRFLQLAQNCKIISPQEYRDEFITGLKNVKGIYEYGK